jgi:hypothetical protein
MDQKSCLTKIVSKILFLVGGRDQAAALGFANYHISETIIAQLFHNCFRYAPSAHPPFIRTKDGEVFRREIYKFGGFSSPIPGASPRGITEKKVRQPPQNQRGYRPVSPQAAGYVPQKGINGLRRLWTVPRRMASMVTVLGKPPVVHISTQLSNTNIRIGAETVYCV